MVASRIARPLANVLLVLAGTVVALAVSEFLVRCFAPQQRPLSVALRGLHRPDEELGHVMVPGFRRHVRCSAFECDVRTNSLGMRDREPDRPVPGRLRVLGLGDSFLFGVHAGALDSCFVKRIEVVLDADLRARPSTASDGRVRTAIEILNAGVDGYGTVQEVGWLRRLGPALQPDAVLLAFYLGNDFTDNSGRTRMTVVDGYQMLEVSAQGLRLGSPSLARQIRLWLHAKSELYLLLKRRLAHPTRRAFARRATAGSQAPKSFDYYLFDAGFADCLRAEPSAQLERGIAATRQALVELRDWCATHGARALVVVIPAEQQVDAVARDRWLRRFGLDAAALDFSRPNRLLAALAAEAGLPLYDLTAEIAARIAAGADLHLHDDNHWNAAGHAVAAQFLEAPLRDVLLPVATRPPGGR